jgi:alpha-D-ribose 1-methylphosphonate 5-triphosphate synthase subunit PhnG
LQQPVQQQRAAAAYAPQEAAEALEELARAAAGGGAGGLGDAAVRRAVVRLAGAIDNWLQPVGPGARRAVADAVLGVLAGRLSV